MQIFAYAAKNYGIENQCSSFHLRSFFYWVDLWENTEVVVRIVIVIVIDFKSIAYTGWCALSLPNTLDNGYSPESYLCFGFFVAVVIIIERTNAIDSTLIGRLQPFPKVNSLQLVVDPNDFDELFAFVQFISV